MSVGAMVAVLTSAWVPAAGQEVASSVSPPAPVVRGAGSGLSNAVVIPQTASNMTHWAWTPATRPNFTAPPPCQPAPLKFPPGLHGLVLSNRALVPTAPAMVPPGVYETAPYNCIVVVPGRHPDDRSIVNPGGGDYSMPMVRPDLRFIPRNQAKK